MKIELTDIAACRRSPGYSNRQRPVRPSAAAAINGRPHRARHWINDFGADQRYPGHAGRSPVCAFTAWLIRGSNHKGEIPRKERRPILVEQYCEARIIRRGDDLLFCASTDGKRVHRNAELPLAQLGEMVIGGANEWFADAGEQNLHEEHVILMPGREGQILTVASHAGGRAEIAQLHAILTRNIVEPRHDLLRLLEKELAERQHPAGGTDIPQSI